MCVHEPWAAVPNARLIFGHEHGRIHFGKKWGVVFGCLVLRRAM